MVALFSSHAGTASSRHFSIKQAVSRLRIRRCGRRRCSPFFLLAFAFSAPLNGWAQVTDLRITSNVLSPQPLGTPVLFQATATNALDYQYRVKGPLDSSFRMVRDFNGFGTLVWAPMEHEGTYQVRVVARSRNDWTTATATMLFRLTSRVTGNEPVISLTPHP